MLSFSNPKISVITVCYNSIDTIEKTILSVINQNYKNLEYIIIDGGSTDGTVEIIKKYHDKISYWITEKDNGIYYAMNKGILVSTGDWINFMNSGDTFFDNGVLSKVAASLKNEIDIAYGQLMKVFKNFRFISAYYPINLDKMKSNARLPHQAIFSKSSYQKKNLFDTSYKSAADFNFYYKAYFIDRCNFQHLPFIIANYDSESGMSKDSFIGPYESYIIQGRKKNKKLLYYLIFKYKIIKLLKNYLPNQIISKIRIDKFKKQGYTIIEN